ncbi:hypothetical protein HY468_02035 [Candidatus Roizmanbacteria bacterium]|nr:hypothetical protein [Candidatus Roizmanbacteria bacterium]
MKLSARFFGVFFAILVFCFLSLSKADAYNPYTAPNTTPDVDQNMHTLTQNIVIETLAAVSCQLIGIDPLESTKPCLAYDPKIGKITYDYSHNGGAIGFVANQLAVLYTPPLHSTDYFDDLASNFGIAKPAYAQGIGFQSLSPLLNIWKVFVNITYLVFVLVFVILGIAIMLRVKIDPRTVMSIENQVPNIIIALLLTTFSFAIAGFLIDLMYVSIYVIFNVFSDPSILPAPHGATLVHKIADTQKNFNGQNPFEVFNNLIGFKELVISTSGSIKDIIQNMFSAQGSDLISIIKNGIMALVGWIFGGIAMIVIAAAILIALFRLWFALIQAYILLLIHTVLAPFWIVGGLIPGSPVNFSGWLREMTSNLSVFPVTITMFLLGRVFISAFDIPQAGVVFVPPMIGSPNQQGSFQPIASLIGLGFILMTPVVVQMMKDLLKAPQFKYMAAIGQSVGSGRKLGMGSLGKASGTYFEATRGSATPGEKGRQYLLRKMFAGH